MSENYVNILEPEYRGKLPFIDYVYEDKSEYKFAKDGVNYVTRKPYLDRDNDFKIGRSGGLLMNIDFEFRDTHKLNERSRFFEENKTYCEYKRGTVKYDDFWIEEARRRKLGYTANCKLLYKDIDKYENALSDKDRVDLLHPIRISGHHYHYLNYGRMMITPTQEQMDLSIANHGVITDNYIEGFPRMWDGDYWNFKLDEFIFNNGLHSSKGKARGKGYSFKRANQAANTMNLYKKTTIVLLAYEDKYLTSGDGTTVMLREALEWLEQNTYWKRGLGKEELENLWLGVKLGNSHKIRGWQSKALSFSLRNNESAAVGKRAREIDFEEAGVCPNLIEAIKVTMNSMEVGSTKIGTMRVYGTAGTKSVNWQGFATAFYNPRRFKMVAMENVWDDKARHATCGFFHPQVWNLEPFIDENGNSRLIEAYNWDIEDKKGVEEAGDLEFYYGYIGQRANKPAEAFRTGQQNIFSTPELDDHVKNVRINSDLQDYRDGMVFPKDGHVVFKTNEQLKNEGRIKLVHPYILDVPFDPNKDVEGCIRMFYPPYKVNGVVPKNLYYGVFDTVKKDKAAADLTIRNSLNAGFVFMYPNGVAKSKGDIMVASYVGRPTEATSANLNMARLGQLYNAEILPETNVGTYVSDCKINGLLKYVAKNPTSLIEGDLRAKKNAPYGMEIPEGKAAELATINLKQLLYTPVGVDEDGNKMYFFHFINDLPTLLELQMYNAKGNFDRISALRLLHYMRMAYLVKKTKPEDVNEEETIFDQIGLYADTESY